MRVRHLALIGVLRFMFFVLDLQFFIKILPIIYPKYYQSS